MMKNVIIHEGTAEDFFKRGREVAKLADTGRPIPEGMVITFETPDDVARIVTSRKMQVLQAVKAHPACITDIAKQLQRDRSAVKRDVDALLSAGLVTVQEKTLPGHGRMKEVAPVARNIKIQVTF